MQSRKDWSQWTEVLRRLKLDGLVSWLLEAGSPLAPLSANALYIVQPFIGGKTIGSIAHMLEEEEEIQGFVRTLRGEES